MGTEMTIAGNGGMTEKLAYASELARSELLPDSFKRNPANVLWAIEFGHAVGIPPITAINGVHVIKGKVCASANLISALVRRAGHRLRVSATDTTATARIWRSDDPEFAFEATWTMDRARTAGLTGNPTWKNFPASMLKSRAITECARMACEEALNGVDYTPEELGADVDASGVPTQATAVSAAIVVDSSEPVGFTDDNDRKAFMAKLGELGVKYDDLKAHRESQGKAKPSLLTGEQRVMLLKAMTPGNKPRRDFDAWKASQSPAPALDAELTADAPDNAPEGQRGPSADVLAGRVPAVCEKCAKPYTYSSTNSGKCADCCLA